MPNNRIFDKNCLSKKIILITGASSGIGRQCAIQLSELGARLILIGRNIDKLQETRKFIGSNEAIVVEQDLNSPTAYTRW